MACVVALRRTDGFTNLFLRILIKPSRTDQEVIGNDGRELYEAYPSRGLVCHIVFSAIPHGSKVGLSCSDCFHQLPALRHRAPALRRQFRAQDRSESTVNFIRCEDMLTAEEKRGKEVAGSTELIMVDKMGGLSGVVAQIFEKVIDSGVRILKVASPNYKVGMIGCPFGGFASIGRQDFEVRPEHFGGDIGIGCHASQVRTLPRAPWPFRHPVDGV